MGTVLLLATWAHEYMDVFVNIDGHLTWGRLTKLELCDLDKTWLACQTDDNSCSEYSSEFFIVIFSYNQTKR